MKYFMIFVILVSLVVIIPQSFGECISLPCDDANILLGEPNYRFIDFSYANTFDDSITFILERIAYGNCTSFKAEIIDKDGNLVWSEGSFALCDPNDNPSLTTSQIKIGYNEDNPIIINESGNYFIKIEIDGGSIEREFIVRQNFAGGTLDHTKYPIPWNNFPYNESPLKQLYAGISPDEVICKNGLSMYQKKNGLVACVTVETGEKLVQRNWAVEFPMHYIIDHRYWSKTYLIHHGMCAHIGVQQKEKMPDSIAWEMTLEDLEKIPIIKSMIEYNLRGLYSSSEYPITDTVVSDDIQNQYRQVFSEIKNSKDETDKSSTFRYDGKYYQASFMIC